jgi:hypothetical protein
MTRHDVEKLAIDKLKDREPVTRIDSVLFAGAWCVAGVALDGTVVTEDGSEDRKLLSGSAQAPDATAPARACER